MRNLLLLLLAVAFFACGETPSTATATTPEVSTENPMTKPAEQSAVKMTPIFHSAVVLEYDGKTIFIDPYDKPEKFEGFAAPDMVLITHTHGEELGDERYYFSGDTGPVDEMRALNDIDFAFVCMNLPYTMTMEDAADAVLDFKPRVVYPFHYRNKDGTFMDTEKFAEMVTKRDKSIEVRVLDWYK